VTRNGEAVRQAVICSPLRTAVGRYGGMFRGVTSSELAATVIREIVSRNSIDPAQIDDVLLGQCYPSGEAPAIGRVAALDAGLPVSVPGYQIDRRCGSGLQSIINAAMQVQTGVSDLVLAGGTESMSQAEYYTTAMRWGARAENVTFFDRLARGRVTAGGVNHPVPGGMLETAENLRRAYDISRQEQDELSLRSHQRAVEAQRSGVFRDEIVAVTVTDASGETAIDVDEHPRPNATIESLSALRPIMARDDPGATVTAGNASGQNDGAAVCLVTSAEMAKELGLRPIARLRSWAVAGVEPSHMGIGPVPATAKALDWAGLKLADISLIELNEAFAAQVLACTREWGFSDSDFDRLNVNGSGISLGHPVGATGGRILATLLREMERRGAALGLETMCIGGGQGLAAIFEAVD
jgi:acetyl-CoA C-acetyltransferase